MAERTAYRYVIVGGGLAGASAVEGIRQIDKEGSILLICGEDRLPYHRPPLSKALWSGKKKVEDIGVKPQSFYDANGVSLALGTKVVALDAERKTISDSRGRTIAYEKLLLATGGMPKKLDVPGGDLEGVCYYRNMADYAAIRAKSVEGASAVVIGGGFIGSEMAAALHTNKVKVTMVYSSDGLCSRVFPASLARVLQENYRQRGITIHAGQKPLSISRADGRFVTRTSGDQTIESDVVIVGVGIAPSVELAKSAGLKTSDGVEVDQFLRTSRSEIYAAGDVALFPEHTLGRMTRLEHWDGALSQGRQAGRNMAGANEPYEYMAYFYSDLFEFGYEAVGQVDSRLEVVADTALRSSDSLRSTSLQKENEKGVLYYLREGKVRGVMLCNVWKKLDQARELIRQGGVDPAADLRGAIK